MWRKPFGKVPDSERWIGVGILSAALGLRVLAAYYVFNTPGMLTFPLALIGAFVMVGGLGVLRWAAAPLLFLCFMFPLPMAGEKYVLKPLNTVAVTASTYTLQTLGVECYRQKNVIKIDRLEDDLAVIDQCSGLRMVTIFLALAVGYAMVVPMQWWERLTIVAFAIPIAVFVNLGRIVATGLLYLAAENTSFVTKDIAKHVFHNWAGYFMMPAALGLLFLLRYVLSRLIVEEAVVHAPVRTQPGSTRLGTLVGK
jgi:exosortase